MVLVLSILLTPPLVRVSFAILDKCRCKSSKKNIPCVSMVLLIISLLLESAVYTKELQRNVSIRKFFAAWILTSVVISTAYKGDNFAKAAAPTGIQKVENFHQLSGFHLFSKAICLHEQLQFQFPLVLYCTEFGYRLSSSLQQSLGDSFYKLISLAYNQSNWRDFNFMNAIPFNLTQDVENTRLLFRTHQAPVDVNYSVVDSLIGKCNKTAYVGGHQEIQRLVRDFDESGKLFMYSGKERFLEKVKYSNKRRCRLRKKKLESKIEIERRDLFLI